MMAGLLEAVLCSRLHGASLTIFHSNTSVSQIQEETEVETLCVVVEMTAKILLSEFKSEFESENWPGTALLSGPSARSRSEAIV